MDEEEIRKPVRYELGMPLDTLSVDELEARIALCEQEIARLRQAIEARVRSRSAAEAAFKF